MTRGEILAADLSASLKEYEESAADLKKAVSKLKKIASRVSPAAVALARKPDGTDKERRNVANHFSDMVGKARPYSEKYIIDALYALAGSRIDPEKMVKYSQTGKRGKNK